MKFPLVSASLALAVMMLWQGDAMVTIGQERNAAAPVDTQQALVNQYCMRCHSDRAKLGGFSWTTVDLAHPEQNAEQAERVIRKLRGGLMPPAGQPRPDGAALDAFIS